MTHHCRVDAGVVKVFSLKLHNASRLLTVSSRERVAREPRKQSAGADLDWEASAGVVSIGLSLRAGPTEGQVQSVATRIHFPNGNRRLPTAQRAQPRQRPGSSQVRTIKESHDLPDTGGLCQVIVD